MVKFQFEIMRCHVATTYYFNYRWRAGFLPVAGAALGDPGVYESWLPSFGDDGGSRNCSADDQRTLSCLCSYSSRPRGRVRVHRAGGDKSGYYTKYIAKVGGMPADAEDLTMEQRSAMVRRRSWDCTAPYSDFAQKCRSFVLQEDCSFLAKMVPGPACFTHWQASCAG